MNGPSHHPTDLFEELKRRRVFRATAVYVVVALGTVEAADLIFPRLQLPDWTVTLVVALAILGLPVTVALSWVFDIRPAPGTKGSTGTAQGESSAAGPGKRAGRTLATGRRTRAGIMAAAGGAVVLVLAGASWLVLDGTDSGLVEDRVVVAMFDNRTGDPSLDPISDMVVDWVTRGLMRAPSLQVVPPEGVLRAGTIDGAAAGDAGLPEATGAGTVVSGSYYLQGDSIWFEAKVTDARRDRLLLALEPVAAHRSRPLDGVEILRRRVTGALAQSKDPALVFWAQHGGKPPSYEAYEAFSRGMEIFLAGDWRGALPHLLQAYAEDSSYVPPLLQAAVAHLNLGEHAQVDSLLGVVEPVRENMLPMDRFSYDYLRAATRGDLKEQRRLARLSMDRFPAAGIDFLAASHAYYLNQPGETVAVLEQMEPDQVWRALWYPYWMFLAAGHHLLGSYEEELEVSREAWDRFPDRRLQIVAMQARALAALGRLDALNERLEAAGEDGSSGTYWIGEVFSETARELTIHGYPGEARALRDRALAWFEARQTVHGESSDFQYDLAVTLFDAGRLEESQTVLEKLLRERPDALPYHGYVGLIAAAQGDSATVAGQIAVIENWAEENRYAHGRHKRWLAYIAAQQGNAAQAVALLREAFEEGFPGGAYLHADAAFELGPIRNYPPLRELLEPNGW